MPAKEGRIYVGNDYLCGSQSGESMNNQEEFIRGLPKAELHLHIEGTFEPELMFSIAKRNGVALRYDTVEDLRKAYNFSNLQEFLDIYYAGAASLIREEDFYELTMAYMKKANDQGVVHTEIFFDPQTHTARGIAFGTVVGGIERALTEAERNYGISSKIIMCFLRHLDEQQAYETLEMADPWLDKIHAVGLDSSEKGNPPEKFAGVFARARLKGLLCVAHAGEEGPAAYVHGALESLKVSRIDHGNRSLDDPRLMEVLAERQIPLTLCPLSNLKLCVIKDMSQHPLRKLLEAGLLVTVNSDDPAYFGGYVNENFLAVAEALKLNRDEITHLAANSIRASFADEERKSAMLSLLDAYISRHLIQ